MHESKDLPQDGQRMGRGTGRGTVGGRWENSNGAVRELQGSESTYVSKWQRTARCRRACRRRASGSRSSAARLARKAIGVSERLLDGVLQLMQPLGRPSYFGHEVMVLEMIPDSPHGKPGGRRRHAVSGQLGSHHWRHGPHGTPRVARARSSAAGKAVSLEREVVVMHKNSQHHVAKADQLIRVAGKNNVARRGLEVTLVHAAANIGTSGSRGGRVHASRTC